MCRIKTQFVTENSIAFDPFMFLETTYAVSLDPQHFVVTKENKTEKLHQEAPQRPYYEGKKATLSSSFFIHLLFFLTAKYENLITHSLLSSSSSSVVTCKRNILKERSSGSR